MTSPNLLLIVGSTVHRYVHGKRVESAAMDPESAADAKEFRQNLNYLLKHGMPEEDPAAEPRDPGEVAFERMAAGLGQ